MREKMENIDVILYCTDMTVARLPSEIISISALTERFGDKFWQKSVFVMTKGNAIGFGTAKGSSREYHKNVYYNLKRELCSKLIDLKVSKHIAESVPAVVAGYIDVHDEGEDTEHIAESVPAVVAGYIDVHDEGEDTEHIAESVPAVVAGYIDVHDEGEDTDVEDPNRCLLYVSDQIKETDPPTRHDFLPEMWVTCFHQIVSEKARGYFWVFSGNDRVQARKRSITSPYKNRKS